MNFHPKKPKYVNNGYIKIPFSLMKLFLKKPPKKRKKEKRIIREH
jgi:hypothetical protein